MIKLVIDNIEGFVYTLRDENNNVYTSNMEFYYLENKPSRGDYIFVNGGLLKLINNYVLSFGPLESKYGREIKDKSDEDYIVLNINNEAIELKRLYG